MKMSRADTTALWDAVRDNDYVAFTRINNRLLNTPTALKHVPIRLYIPSQPPPASEEGVSSPSETSVPETGAFKIAQYLVSATVAGAEGARARHPRSQTLGMALRILMPELFPSSRDPIIANVVMHGAPVPFAAPLGELMKEAAYPDGWICLVVVLLG